MLLGTVACNSGESANNKPMLSVAQAALYCDLGESVTLPAATAEDERDGDISASVKVTVYQGETVALAESAGNVEQMFTPSAAGDYVARYVVKNSAGVSSDIKEVNISVGEVPTYTEGKPTITVDTSADSSTSANVRLRAATGASAAGADLSSNVRVALYDSKNVTKFEGAGNVAQTVEGLADGTYTVVYTLEHEGRSADPAQYILTVATGGDLKPFLSAPLTDVTVFEGENVSNSTANASDLIDGDLSDKVEYRIEKADGTQVVAKTAAILKNILLSTTNLSTNPKFMRGTGRLRTIRIFPCQTKRLGRNSANIWRWRMHRRRLWTMRSVPFWTRSRRRALRKIRS